MPEYIYKARDTDGKVVTGKMEAENEQQVKTRLREKNIIPTSVVEKQQGFDFKEFVSKFQKVKTKDVSIFSRQFATMVSAGLSLVRALDILEKQSTDKKLKEIIHDVRLKVESGSALAEAFANHPTTFSELYINLTHAGEVGGVLDETLKRVAEFLEKDQELKSKVKSAMTYPTVVLFIAVVICIFLLVSVLPAFADIFNSLGSELPVPTKILLALSAGLRKAWWLFIIGFIGIVAFFKYYTSTPRGQYNWHSLMLKVPVFGMLNRKVTISRFSRTLGTLLSSGVPVMQALEVTGRASGNKVVEKAIDSVRVSIREGETISKPMEATGIFPPMVTQMVEVGEETGNLDAMLDKISDFYDMEVETTLESLTSLLEPIMMVFMGGMVGFIVMAMFMPMFQMINAV